MISHHIIASQSLGKDSITELANLEEVNKLAKKKAQRSDIISKIKGPYTLLGLFLLVVESLLGAWLIRAESENERIASGILMTLIFVMFLIVLPRIVTQMKGAEKEKPYKPVPIKLTLKFPEPLELPIPSKPAHFQETECSYTIYDKSTKVHSDKPVKVHVQVVDRVNNIFVPYIHVEAPGIDEPDFEIKLKYKGHEWLSDSSYSPTRGDVNLEPLE